MSQSEDLYMEQKMEELVEKFFEKDLVTPEGKLEAEFLLAKNEPGNALEVVLDKSYRKESTGSNQTSESPRRSRT